MTSHIDTIFAGQMNALLGGPLEIVSSTKTGNNLEIVFQISDLIPFFIEHSIPCGASCNLKCLMNKCVLNTKKNHRNQRAVHFRFANYSFYYLNNSKSC